MSNVSTSSYSPTTTGDYAVEAFAAFWKDVWMTGNVACESVGIPATFLSSIFTVAVLCRIKEGIAVSAKMYYFTLAVMDFFAAFGYHFLLSYIDEDFRYLSNNTVFVAIEIHNYLCQFIYITLRQSEHTANWLYLVLCVEKLIAVERPLIARNKFTKRWSVYVVIACVVTAIPVDIICILAYGPYYYPVWGVTYCTILGTLETSVALFVRLYISFTIYFLPSCATVFVGMLLLKSIVVQAHRRKDLTADSTNAVNKAGLNGAVTVLIMAGIHSLMFMPLGFFSCWSVLLLFNSNANPYMTYSITYTFWLLWNVSVLAHCTNFFIYILRIPQFRKTFCCQKN